MKTKSFQTYLKKHLTKDTIVEITKQARLEIKRALSQEKNDTISHDDVMKMFDIDQAQ